MPEDLKSLLDRALQIGSSQATPVNVEDGVPYALVPQGYVLTSLAGQIYNENREHPQRKTGAVIVEEPDSFNEYWKLFADADSQAFADPDEARIVGVLDYHQVGEHARWKKHQVTLQLVESDEWTEWSEKNRKAMNQVDFAEFLEDHAPDIIEPPAATFIDAARDLKAKADVNFESKVSSANGSVNFNYNEAVVGSFGKGNIEIPERFKIAVQIYLGMPKTTLEARLRYRINGGKLSMWYDLYRMDYVQREAFQDVVENVEAAIGKKVFIGKP